MDVTESLPIAAEKVAKPLSMSPDAVRSRARREAAKGSWASRRSFVQDFLPRLPLAGLPAGLLRSRDHSLGVRKLTARLKSFHSLLFRCRRTGICLNPTVAKRSYQVLARQIPEIRHIPYTT